MDLFESMAISASGMKAQGTRLRVISENIANKDSMADRPGLDPYRRRVVTFRTVLDDSSGASMVEVNRITTDNSQLEIHYDPQHPAADEDGYVAQPNVNMLMEMMDMREAQRSYEANLNVIDASKRMLRQSLEALRR